jgi:hypothetical protein
VSEDEIEATYGPVRASHRASRESLVHRFVVAGGSFTVGVALLAFCALVLRPGPGSLRFVVVSVLVGAIALVLPPFLLLSNYRAWRYDVLELRANGIVRRSKERGLKHCLYAEIDRIERRAVGRSIRIDVFTHAGGLIALDGFEGTSPEVIDEIVRRARNLGADAKLVEA